MKKGMTVKWKYGGSETSGKVQSTHNGPVTVEIKGKEITRNGSPDNPALKITMADGSKVIKLQSEVKLGRC